VRPDRYVYLRRRGDSVVCSTQPSELGPLSSRRTGQLAARALQGVEWETLEDALPKLQAKLRRLSRDLRFEDAARLRDRIAALETAAGEVQHMRRLRDLSVCLVVPGEQKGSRRGIYVAKGQVVCIRPFLATSGVEWQAALADVARAEPTLSPEAADDLRVLASFIRRPPPELTVVPLAHSAPWKSFVTEPSRTAGASSSSTA
jgi:hypothetical protein